MKWILRKARKLRICAVCKVPIPRETCYWQAKENHAIKRHRVCPWTRKYEVSGLCIEAHNLREAKSIARFTKQALERSLTRRGKAAENVDTSEYLQANK